MQKGAPLSVGDGVAEKYVESIDVVVSEKEYLLDLRE